MNTFEASYDNLYVYYRIGPVVQEEEIFKFREFIIAILLLSPDVKRYCLSIWTKLIRSHRDGILFAKFFWKWPRSFFLILMYQTVFQNFRLISIQLICIYEVNWEMAKTQREWITPAAAPLQRSHGVVAVSMEYQNKNKKIGDGYVIAATFKLHTKSTYLILILIFYISQILKSNSWSLEKIHLNMAHYHP